MDIVELSALLWRERSCQELLVFKLEEERLLLQAGQTQWLQRAAREAEAAHNRLREVRAARSAGTSAVARRWRLPAEASLGELSVSAPRESWGSILSAHLLAATELDKQIESLQTFHEQSLKFDAHLLDDLLAALSRDTGGLSPTGSPDRVS